MFYDVSPDDWYYASVVKAYSLGLVNGRGNGRYAPDGILTVAEAVKLAACIRERVLNGASTLENGDPWYSTYAVYAAQEGILAGGQDMPEDGALTLSDVEARANDPITRASFAWLFSRALPAGTLPEINGIPDGSIPDVTQPGEIRDAVYMLYRAGILNGSDSRGTFRPEAPIKRSEVAAVAVRMILSEERVGAPAAFAAQ